MSSPLVSIIVPVYNVQKYLKKCINSLILQSYQNLEIILIDDGATDCCSYICDKFQEQDSRIKVIHKENRGLSEARNTGIDIHKGKYIFFVDSDDYIHTETINSMVAIAEKNAVDIVECGVLKVKESNKNCFEHIKYENEILLYNHDEALLRLLNYKLRIMVWNKLYISSLFKDIRFPAGKVHEDEYVIPYIVDKCNRYAVISNQYYAYVQRAGSIMTSAYTNRKLDIIDAYLNRYKFFSNKYNGRFDTVINYHFFVACVKLKVLMGEEYDGSIVEEKVKALSNKLLKDRKIGLKTRIKICSYLVMPQIIIKLKEMK